MALTLPNTFADLSVLSSSDWAGNYYNPTTPDETFEVINGHLDSSDMAAGWAEVTREQVQRYQLVGGGFVAGTANLDYFPSWFKNLEIGETFRPNRARAIPGATREFYLAEPAAVGFCWTIMWTNMSNDNDAKSRIYLNIDGTIDQDIYRDVARVGTTAGAHYYDYRTSSLRKLTYWSGFHMVELAAGWHRVGLRLYAQEEVPQTRIWARSFRVVWFKKAATWG